jgi:hypothetical protein
MITSGFYNLSCLCCRSSGSGQALWDKGGEDFGLYSVLTPHGSSLIGVTEKSGAWAVHSRFSGNVDGLLSMYGLAFQKNGRRLRDFASVTVKVRLYEFIEHVVSGSD